MIPLRPALLLGVILSAQPLAGAEPVVRLGAGSYATQPPPGAKGPPETRYVTDAVRGPVPTNDWWSSVVWLPHSERQYPHPLAVAAEPRGLRVFYPDRVTANALGVFAAMPGGDADLVVGHSAVDGFPDARLDRFSDWFVDVAFASGDSRMTVSYGHGSPFVYAMVRGGDPVVRFAKAPGVWSGDPRSAVLGVSIGGKPYALFGPTGATWTGLGTATFTCNSGGKPHFSLAALPEQSDKALALFRRFAHAHVTDTRIQWHYHTTKSTVETVFRFTVTPREGEQSETLFALYPHQWRNTPTRLLPLDYSSVRGRMRLGAGKSFTTCLTYPGVLPALPDAGACDRAKLQAMLESETRVRPGTKDTYWEGKLLGRLAALVPIAEQAGSEPVARKLAAEIRRRLEGWLTATDSSGHVKRAGLFTHHRRWGTLIGYPAAYGSDTELNDHHFHYGYFLRAAAVVARREPGWAGPDRFGPMLRLLARDVACPERDDAQFPFLRCFDPYAGHSWASGAARFADGNNQESSSEAVNAWCALILLGEAAGDEAMRDLGVFLYATEVAAIEEYWFDVLARNRPEEYEPPVVTMVWGGKGVHETWFSANPEAKYGINWLPIHGGSLYLGRYPELVERSYAGLVRENGGRDWDQWADLVWMYRALADPEDAMRQFDARPGDFRPEPGNSLAATYHWVANLRALGRVDRALTADCPLYAAFDNGKTRTYAVYSMRPETRVATFSDGTRVEMTGQGPFLKRK